MEEWRIANGRVKLEEAVQALSAVSEKLRAKEGALDDQLAIDLSKSLSLLREAREEFQLAGNFDQQNGNLRL